MMKKTCQQSVALFISELHIVLKLRVWNDLMFIWNYSHTIFILMQSIKQAFSG